MHTLSDRHVAPSDSNGEGGGRDSRPTCNGGKSLHRLQFASAGIRKRRPTQRRDGHRGYWNRSTTLGSGDSAGSYMKARQSQKPKKLPLLCTPSNLISNMASLSIAELSSPETSFSEKGEWDGEDGLAMHLLTASYDDAGSWAEDSGCGSSRSSSVTSSCRTSSWESLTAIFGPPGQNSTLHSPQPQETFPDGLDIKFDIPLEPEFKRRIPKGLDIKIDLGTTIRDFQTAVLPFGNIDMYMQNRSQYHRLTQQGDDDKMEFKQVKCSYCCFYYTVPVED